MPDSGSWPRWRPIARRVISGNLALIGLSMSESDAKMAAPEVPSGEIVS